MAIQMTIGNQKFVLTSAEMKAKQASENVSCNKGGRIMVFDAVSVPRADPKEHSLMTVCLVRHTCA